MGSTFLCDGKIQIDRLTLPFSPVALRLTLVIEATDDQLTSNG